MSTETPQNLTPDILVITQDINKQETKFPARYITFIFMGYYAVVSLNLSQKWVISTCNIRQLSEAC